MASINNGRPHLKLGLMLLISFLLVGGSVGIAVLRMTVNRAAIESRSDALSVAKLMAMQFPAPAVAGQETGVIQQTLSKLRTSSPSIRQVSLFVRSGRRFIVFTPDQLNPDLVNAEQTGMIGEVASRVFETGIGDAEDLTRTAPQSIITAYGAIKANNKVVGIVKVDRDADSFILRTQQSQTTALWIATFLAVLSSILSLTWVSRLAKLQGEVSWLRKLNTTTRLFKATVLEITLITVSLFTLTTAVFGFMSEHQSQAVLENSLARSEKLEVLRSRLERVVFEEEISNEVRSQLTSIARGLGDKKIASKVRTLTMSNYNRATGYRVREFSKEVQALQNKERARQLAIQGGMERRDMNLAISLFVTVALAFGSLVLVRAASNQQQDYHSALLESQRHRGAYDQLTDSLPVGLYTFKQGKLEYTNKAWNKQTLRVEKESADLSFRRSLHPDDKDEVLTALRDFEKMRYPFEMQYRMLGATGEIHYIETRGVPVTDLFGNFEHMLGFSIDVTSRVQAQELMEQRNRETENNNRKLHQAFSELELNFEAMVNSLVRAVEAKDPYTAGHSERVMGYSVKIGKALGYSASDLRILERGCLVHDIGKIGIPDAILTKPDRLLQEEYEIIKQHPDIGYRMIKDIPIFRDCIPIVRWHHERLDGRGYPDGLVGNQIPEMVRIAAVADVFDALTSTRAYRKGMNIEKALSILQSDAEKGALDIQFVQILADIVRREGLLWEPGIDDLAA